MQQIKIFKLVTQVSKILPSMLHIKKSTWEKSCSNIHVMSKWRLNFLKKQINYLVILAQPMH